MTTIRSVAELAGVSIATISRVLNNKGKVSAETAERVRAIVKELGYVYEQQPLKRRQVVIKPQGIFAIILLTCRIHKQLHCWTLLNKKFNTKDARCWYITSGDARIELGLLNICKQQKVDGLFIVPSSNEPKYIVTLNQQPFLVVSLTQLHPELTSVALIMLKSGAQVMVSGQHGAYPKWGIWSG